MPLGLPAERKCGMLNESWADQATRLTSLPGPMWRRRVISHESQPRRERAVCLAQADLGFSSLRSLSCRRSMSCDTGSHQGIAIQLAHQNGKLPYKVPVQPGLLCRFFFRDTRKPGDGGL